MEAEIIGKENNHGRRCTLMVETASLPSKAEDNIDLIKMAPEVILWRAKAAGDYSVPRWRWQFEVMRAEGRERLPSSKIGGRRGRCPVRPAASAPPLRPPHPSSQCPVRAVGLREESGFPALDMAAAAATAASKGNGGGGGRAGAGEASSSRKKRAPGLWPWHTWSSTMGDDRGVRLGFVKAGRAWPGRGSAAGERPGSVRHAQCSPGKESGPRHWG